MIAYSTIALSLLAIAVGRPAAPAAGIEAVQLRREYLVDPLGIDVRQPRLSWQAVAFDNNRRGERQTAYRLLVASSEEALAADRGDLWDSGKVASSDSIQIAYAGAPLASRQRCFWKAKVWDRAGNEAAWSAVAWWTMGLLQPGDWGGARWIGAPPEPERPLNASQTTDGKTPRRHWTIPPSPLLRKKFAVSKHVAHAEVSVTALGEYELKINGRRACDQQLAPEWTNYRRRVQYQTYDVTALLRRGENVVAAQLADGWYAGKLAGTRWSYDFPKRGLYGVNRRLLLRLDLTCDDGSRQTIVSDGSWKIDLDGPIRSADHFAGEIYDARKEVPGWDGPGFDDAAWRNVTVDTAPPIELSAQMNESIRIIARFCPVEVTEPKPGTYIFKLPQNIAGWCRVRLEGPAGTTVVLRHAERLKPDGTLFTECYGGAASTDTFILDGRGPRTFEPHFTYHGFQYVAVTGLSARPSLDMLEACAIASDASPAGGFECSNSLLNQIWHNALWSQRGNMHSVPTDCPNRDERYGYGGDGLSFAETAMDNLDVAAFYTKWTRDWREAQTDEGHFPAYAPQPWFFPRDLHDANTMGWSDAGVLVPWKLYEVYRDRRVLEEHYDAARRYVDSIHAQSKDGIWNVATCGDWLSVTMIKGIAGYSTEGPWTGLPNDVFGTAFAYASTRAFAEMARVLGRDDDARLYGAQADAIRAAFQRHFVKPDGTIAGDNQSTYVLALHFDLLPPDLRAAAARKLVKLIEHYDNRLTTGIIATPKLLVELSKAGYDDVAYRLMESRRFPSLGFMVDQGATTVWERWDNYHPDKGLDRSGMTSFNHCALGGMASWLYSGVLGIERLAGHPAYERFSIHPRPGGSLTWARGEYRSIRGTISSAWEKRADGVAMHVGVPPGTAAEVYVPTSSADRVSESGQPAAKQPGVKFLRAEGGAAVFEVESGHYDFWSPAANVVFRSAKVTPLSRSERLLSDGETLQNAMIWTDAAPSERQCYAAFRKRFDLTSQPTAATLKIFADSRYLLWINGRYVERGPCRFDPKRPEYDTLDVTHFLRSGPNAIAMLVHHAWQIHCARIIDHEPGLTVKLDATLVDGQTVSFMTDSSWRANAKTRYLPSPTAYSSIPDTIDARLDDGKWDQVDFDDSAWAAATPIDGHAWGPLHPRSLPPLRKKGSILFSRPPSDEGRDATRSPHVLRAGEQAIFDVGREVQGYFVLDFTADEGSEMGVDLFVALPRAAPRNRYIARAGRQTYMSGDTIGGRYLVVKVNSGKITLDRAEVVERQYPFARLGRFESSDPLLDKIWDISVRTVELCSEDAYVDCADRERAQWMADGYMMSYPVSRVALAPCIRHTPCAVGSRHTECAGYIYADPRLLRNMLRHMALSQLPDGRLQPMRPSYYPVNARHGVIDDYTCLWVQAARELYDRTGNRDFLREIWPAAQRAMGYFLDRRSPPGLVNAMEFVYFANPLAYKECEGATVNAYIYRALRDATAMAREMDDAVAAERYERAAAELYARYNETLWNETAGSYAAAVLGGRPAPPTMHAAMLALHCDLVPPERQERVYQFMLAHLAEAGDYPYAYRYLFDDMFARDRDEDDRRALAMIRDKWKVMIGRPTGTTSESFGGGSRVHESGAHPAWFLSSYILGVRTEGAAGKLQLRIEPRLADLDRAAGTVLTEFGPVAMSWQRDTASLVVDFEVPTGHAAQVAVPRLFANFKLTVDGRIIDAARDGRRLRWTAASGKHHVVLAESDYAGPAANWPQFRGPTGDGRAVGTEPPLEWSESKNVRWKTAIHDFGHSSPVIWGEQVWLTTGTEDGRTLYALCCDRETGRIIKDIKVFDVEKPETINPLNTYATPTPVIEQGRIYVHFGTYGTACLDTATGRKLWERTDLHCHHIQGPASSPILYGNLLILDFDGGEVQYLIALDKTTGRTVWRRSRSVDTSHLGPLYRKSHSTPIVIDAAHGPQLFAPAAQAAYAYDPATGEELWRVLHGGDSVVSRPLFVGGLIIFSTGFTQSEIWALRPEGRGNVTAKNVAWKYVKDVPRKTSPACVGGLLYLLLDTGTLVCLEVASGKPLWQQRLGGRFSASPIVTADRVYCFNEAGKAVVVAAGRSYRQLAENKLDEGCIASPAAVEGTLFLRGKSHLYRIGQ